MGTADAEAYPPNSESCCVLRCCLMSISTARWLNLNVRTHSMALLFFASYYISTRRLRQTLTARALLLQAWAGEPDNVKKAQDILYQLAVANGQAQVCPCYSPNAGMRALAVAPGNITQSRAPYTLLLKSLFGTCCPLWRLRWDIAYGPPVASLWLIRSACIDNHGVWRSPLANLCCAAAGAVQGAPPCAGRRPHPAGAALWGRREVAASKRPAVICASKRAQHTRLPVSNCLQQHCY
jgi:hypothetical protein